MIIALSLTLGYIQCINSPSWLSSIHFVYYCAVTALYVAVLYWSIMIHNWWCNLCIAPLICSGLQIGQGGDFEASWHICWQSGHRVWRVPLQTWWILAEVIRFCFQHSCARNSCTWRFVCIHFVGDCSRSSILYTQAVWYTVLCVLMVVLSFRINIACSFIGIHIKHTVHVSLHWDTELAELAELVFCQRSCSFTQSCNVNDGCLQQLIVH